MKRYVLVFAILVMVLAIFQEVHSSPQPPPVIRPESSHPNVPPPEAGIRVVQRVPVPEPVPERIPGQNEHPEGADHIQGPPGPEHRREKRRSGKKHGKTHKNG